MTMNPNQKVGHLNLQSTIVPKWAFKFTVYPCADSSTRRTRLDNNTSTALDYYNADGGDMIGNLITRHAGSHANGITLYLGCKDVLVASNCVAEGNVALTFQEAENLTFRNNVFVGMGQNPVVGIWNAQPVKDCRLVNNTLLGGDINSDWKVGLFTNNKKIEGLEVRNNIIEGTYGKLPGTYSHNIYTRDFTSQPIDASAGESLVADLNKLFVDPAAGDYRLRGGSPAIGAGEDGADVGAVSFD